MLDEWVELISPVLLLQGKLSVVGWWCAEWWLYQRVTRAPEYPRITSWYLPPFRQPITIPPGWHPSWNLQCCVFLLKNKTIWSSDCEMTYTLRGCTKTKIVIPIIFKCHIDPYLKSWFFFYLFALFLQQRRCHLGFNQNISFGPKKLKSSTPVWAVGGVAGDWWHLVAPPAQLTHRDCHRSHQPCARSNALPLHQALWSSAQWSVVPMQM